MFSVKPFNYEQLRIFISINLQVIVEIIFAQELLKTWVHNLAETVSYTVALLWLEGDKLLLLLLQKLRG